MYTALGCFIRHAFGVPRELSVAWQDVAVRGMVPRSPGVEKKGRASTLPGGLNLMCYFQCFGLASEWSSPLRRACVLRLTETPSYDRGGNTQLGGHQPNTKGSSCQPKQVTVGANPNPPRPFPPQRLAPVLRGRSQRKRDHQRKLRNVFYVTRLHRDA